MTDCDSSSDTILHAYAKMSAEIHRLFPANLRHVEAERGRPRHSPPLRFVPSNVYTKEDSEDSPLKTITVELAQKISQKVPLYVITASKPF